MGDKTSLLKVEGIDLLCIDNSGDVFPKGENIAISIKTRERPEDRATNAVKVNWEEIKNASKEWNALPYYSYVRIVPEQGKITFFVLPVEKAETYGKNFSISKATRDSKNILFEMSFKPYNYRGVSGRGRVRL